MAAKQKGLNSLRSFCLEATDNSVAMHNAVDFFGVRNSSRDPNTMAARLVAQFEEQNRRITSLMDVRFDRVYDGRDVWLRVTTGNTVGAVPLYSPSSAVPDYGLVIQPRFPWPGIGPMLAEMGWRIAPVPLKLPLLRRSERKVPPWVISCMILARIKALLDGMTRRFELCREIRSIPRGAIHWSEYAVQHMARGAFLSLPCTFPDLRDDRLLLGAIRFSLEKQLRSLESQIEHGAFVHQLVAFCSELLRIVRRNPPYVPSPKVLGSWLQRPMKTSSFAEGLQAIEWTVQDRGLAGPSDLEGIPWHMRMEKFFEAWVETVFSSIARELAGELRVGRKRQTTRAIAWEPGYVGSQKSLVPDLWLDWGGTAIVVDAKYKRHFEEFQTQSWRSVEEEVREQHRTDLFQILAYANLSKSSRVIACLAYPCEPETWRRLVERKTLIHRAEITVGSRAVHLWLTAIPMSTAIEKIRVPLLQELRAIG